VRANLRLIQLIRRFTCSHIFEIRLRLDLVNSFQIRSVSEDRLVRRLGALSEPEMLLISQALAIVLNI
jgi:mRNA-degrading endonuclease toxin of MazEF toxin-antitoxin module